MSIAPDPSTPVDKPEASRLDPTPPTPPAAPPAPEIQKLRAPRELPDGPNRYDGLNNFQLMDLLGRKREAAERERLIRELENRLPRPEEKAPGRQVSDRAKRLRGLQPEFDAAGRDDALRGHFADLSGVFDDLLYHNAGGQGFDEKFGLMIALRAQRQALLTVHTLHRMQEAEKAQTPPGRR